MKGKVRLGKGWVREVSFDGFDKPIVSAANPDLSKLGIEPELNQSFSSCESRG